jgi:hypothetical protein
VARGPDGGVAQALTLYGTDDGLWVLQTRMDPEPVASLQRIGEDDLLALARRLVTR